VRAAEVGRPDRRVVDGPVGLRDLVVQRARRAAVVDDAQCAVVVRRRLGAELREHRPDRVLTLAGELDELALRDLADPGVGRNLALDLHAERLLAQQLLLLRQRALEVVREVV
jgi:hypothetical protein